MIMAPYKQGPWSDSSVHGSEVSGLQGPLEDNPWKETLAKCPMLISKSVPRTTHRSDWRSSKSLWHTCTMPFHTTLFPKTTKDQCESCWII